MDNHSVETGYALLTDRIFAVAQVADQMVLWILIILSVVSIGMIFERFFYLKKISGESLIIRSRVKIALQSQSIDDVENLARSLETLEGRALSHAMKHVKESGSKGLEELFNTFSLVERPELKLSCNGWFQCSLHWSFGNRARYHEGI